MQERKVPGSCLFHFRSSHAVPTAAAAGTGVVGAGEEGFVTKAPLSEQTAILPFLSKSQLSLLSHQGCRAERARSSEPHPTFLPDSMCESPCYQWNTFSKSYQFQSSSHHRASYHSRLFLFKMGK